MKTRTYKLPTIWASALINDDYSGISSGDEADLKNWIKQAGVSTCLEVSDESEFGRFMSMGYELSDYTFEV